ncbi:MAG: 5-amino-6-(D-ribitylamino)uracil--L-tyrosine 4-hydroxyphenyl transferase CofH [Acidimicrobiia bacterium]|nr:5-amino-6-(D-ribitylamino)uracil--L-tyrosine 4-hydroxyphenyl transferase CofH [Acidimicrobiia bacterium]
MTRVTFLRTRPAESVHELWASTRRREGTTSVEVVALDLPSSAAALSGGLLPVAVGRGVADGIGWVVEPGEALDLGVAGWRVTVIDTGETELVLDALVRSKAAYLRTGRGRVADAARLCSLPGVDATVSVFVDSIDDALAAVASGAGDLLLRGWSTDDVGGLRDALDILLIERSAVPVDITIDAAREELPPELFKAYLDQIDGSGVVRPRTDWAAGRSTVPPAPPERQSAAWQDATWHGMKSEDAAAAVTGDVRGILDRALEGQRPSVAEIERLFRSRGDEVDAIARVADRLRARANGDDVTFVVNRNINYTNQCYFRCGFCAFSKGPRSLNLRGDPYLMTVDEIVERTVEAAEAGATEVCLQGGIHPGFTGDFYVEVIEAIKRAVPDMHCHGFTPLEVWQGAETSGVSVHDFLVRLRDAGLGTLPGTAAEILDDRIRRHLCPDKITTAEWAHVMVTAHELGLRSTSTMMFGHIDDPASWANHFDVLRTIQERTGGITEFVPLPFVHMGAPIYLQGRARPGPTWDEVVLVHAVARIAFAGLIDNIQASWVKLGVEGAVRLLGSGCNDLGGTLTNETISRAAGADHGQAVDAHALIEAIRVMGRVPVRRSTLYDRLEELTPLR